MDNATITIGIIGAVLSILTYFAGSKRHSNNEVAERARFEGEIKAKLDQLLLSFEKLENKLTKNTSELYDEINQQIAAHEKRYHQQ